MSDRQRGAVRRRLHPAPHPAPRPAGLTEDSVPVRTDDPPGTVRREFTGSGPVVRKCRGGEAGDRLELEVEVLRAVRCDRVVTVVDAHVTPDRVELVTEDVGSMTLADVVDLPPARLARTLDSAATAVAALHDAGWSHGALRADHLVVGGRGTVTLCSLASARPVEARPSGIADDVAAFRAVLGELAARTVTGPGRRRDRRRLARALESVARDDADLAAVRARLREAVSGAPRRPRPVVAVGALLMTALVAATAATSHRATPAAPAPPAAQTRPPLATRPTVRVDDRRYVVGRPGDVAVTADLTCGGRPGVVLLRPGTGELFASPRLPTSGRPLALVPLGRVGGATSVRTLRRPPDAARPDNARPDAARRCPAVVVDRGGAPPLVLSPDRPTGRAAPTDASPSPTTQDGPP